MTKTIEIKWNDETFIALVDDDAHALLSRHTWYIMFSGKEHRPYPFVEIFSKTQGKRMLYMHHIVTGCYGQVDHHDNNSLNNQFDNLRPATYQENGWNKGKSKRCRHGVPTSQFKGVSYAPYKGRDRWMVLIKYVEQGKHKSTGKMIRVGYFWNEIEAAKAYNKKIVELRGEWAWVNPIPNINAA